MNGRYLLIVPRIDRVHFSQHSESVVFAIDRKQKLWALGKLEQENEIESIQQTAA